MNHPAEPGLSTVLDERRQLINLTYRLLGSLADAEDAVQETFTRWYALTPAQQDEIASPGAWLTTVATRICLDLLGSARARRERYVGEWLPEPLPEPAEWGGADPADRITLDESVSMAFLVVLDTMTPAERVAFVLHDVFGYPFTEIGAIVGRTPAACRQLAVSARRRVGAARTAPPAGDRRTEVVRDFRLAWAAKDIAALLGLLDPDATVVADGGGLVSAVPRPVVGRAEVARFAAGMVERLAGLSLVERTVNGQPGLVGLRDGAVVAVFAFEVMDGLVRHVWAVRNPDKLRPWTASR
ncbi:RNA polymerase sigma factor [Catellatospora sp. IY07-71]|uniref:RNA polymerase sigma factor SigJ n=1 Tax=Catellatospora sp. IY07-71 TaxID=2728827 RepID=UPI001BB4D617|nr:RNA polymerase sigma factor SigJ [Catellatospora sp. IY07-71]BCJ74019.1 RNA polymerase sigma factor [Catellatospora sp. IY07-71]